MRHDTATTRIAAVINPAAAGGRALHTWKLVEKGLRARGIAVQEFLTRGPGDGEAQASLALDAGYSTLLAVGGDGTLHQVVNALRTEEGIRGDVRVGIVPAGTGMDFSRNVHVPRGSRAAIDRIVRGVERRIDVGVVAAPHLRLFVNFAESGLGASVVAREAGFSARWPGRASFFLAGLAAAARDHPVHGTVTVDGRAVYAGRMVSLVVANGAFFGGGMKIAPPASMEDGALDVVLLGDLSRVELVSQIWKLYPGTHLHNPHVHWMRGTTVAYDPLGPGRLDLDGELYDGGPCRISVLPRALRILG